MLAQESVFGVGSVDGGGGVFWALFCHTNTMLIEFKVYKTSKFFLQYSCNIHVDTIETTMSSFFRFFFLFLSRVLCSAWQ